MGCRGQRLEQSHARRPAEARATAPGRCGEPRAPTEPGPRAPATPRASAPAPPRESADGVVAVTVLRGVVTVDAVRAGVAVPPVRAGVTVPVRTGALTPRRARHAATAQARERCGDGIGRVVGSGRHASNLHAT